MPGYLSHLLRAGMATRSRLRDATPYGSWSRDVAEETARLTLEQATHPHPERSVPTRAAAPAFARAPWQPAPGPPEVLTDTLRGRLDGEHAHVELPRRAPTMPNAEPREPFLNVGAVSLAAQEQAAPPTRTELPPPPHSELAHEAPADTPRPAREELPWTAPPLRAPWAHARGTTRAEGAPAPRPAGSFTAPAQPPLAPEIHVTIGRVEVSAQRAAPHADKREPAPRRKPLTLDAYLSRRERGGR